MSKLVDKERLARLAQALDTRMKAAVQAEKERAMAAEQAIEGDVEANAAAIAAINDGETGILKQAKDYADGVANTEKERAEAAENTLGSRIETLEGKFQGGLDDFLEGLGDDTTIGGMMADINANTAKLDGIEEETVKAAIEAAVEVEKGRAEGQETAIRQELANEKKALQDEIDADVKAEADRAKGVEAELLQAIQDEATTARAAEKLNKDAIDVLNGDENKEGSVKKQIADAIADVKSEVTDGLADRVEDLEERMTTAEADIDAVEAKLTGLEKDTVQASIDAAQADAEAKAAELDATLKQELQNEIDNDVQVVADELAKQKDAAQDGSLAHQIKVEKERMDAFLKDADVQDKAVDTLKELQEYINTHGEAAQKMVEDIAANKTAIEAEAARAAKKEGEIDAKDLAQDNRIQALEDANKEGGDVAKAIAAAQSAADKAQGEVDAVELRVDSLEAKVGHDVEGENPATGLFLEIDEAKAAAAAAQKAADDEADRAAGQETAIRGEMAAEATRVNNKIASDIATAVGVYASEGVEASGLRKEIAEKDAAVRADFAQADSNLHATIKGEMAAIVQSLQAEITDDGKLRLSLGGGDTVVAICEKELPFATDADIDEIINGLDA